MVGLLVPVRVDQPGGDEGLNVAWPGEEYGDPQAGLLRSACAWVTEGPKELGEVDARLAARVASKFVSCRLMTTFGVE